MLDLTTIGVVGDGVTDNHAIIQEAINSSEHTVFTLPAGEFRVGKTLQIPRRGITIIGNYHGRKEEHATIIKYTGNNDLFKLGGADTPAFGGIQGFKLQNLSLVCDSSMKASLENPYSRSVSRHMYNLTTAAIADYRGGGLLFENVQIERFEIAIYGEQSDINRFTNCNFFYNKTGLEFYTGSDQMSVNGCYFLGNDRSVYLEGVAGARFNDCQFVKEGAASETPIQLEGCKSIRSAGCWFEGLGKLGATVPAYVSIGKSMECKDVFFRDSTLAIGDPNTDGSPVCNYFVTIKKGKKILIDEVGGYPKNLKQLVLLAASDYKQASVTVRAHLDFTYPAGGYIREENAVTEVASTITNYWQLSKNWGSGIQMQTLGQEEEEEI
ncbi:Pectate lyase superfamily protein [compost metagenome]